MAAVNLPDNPANGTTQTVGGITYTYNSSKGYWTAASSGGGGGGGASVSTSDAAPGSPSDGDLWYDTDDGGMFVYYQDTDSSQWVEVIGSQGAAGPTGAAGATTAGVASVYATVDALPTSGNTQGDMAHVTANNTLYFWNGSGWYKIALINTNPSISGVASAYSLAIDGTATTVTMTATDPEGLPITYSIVSDTSGNIASVSQGTGASTNVFTITPSTNTAYAGSFTLTFRASDGVNVATAPATFTLQFTVANQKYTTALITSVGANNAVNNTFDDKSTSNHTITANGDAHQTTFSPYRHGGYSAYFDGNGDYLQIANHTDNDLSSGDWTVELWAYVPSAPAVSGNFFSKGTYVSTYSYSFAVLANGSLLFESGNGNWSSTNYTSTAGDFPFGQWNHVALVRNGTSVDMYCNGSRVKNITSASMPTNTSDAFRIGAFTTHNDYYLTGYIRDLRLIKGTALYTGTSYTVPTESLTAITNTKLLTCHLPYIADGSTTGHSIAVNGNTKTEPFAPYDAQEYSAASHLGSASLDGTGDFLSVADHADFEFGSGDFTMEAWIYLTGYSNSYGGYYAGGIMGKDSASNRSLTFSVVATSNSYTGLQLYLFNGGTSYSTIGTASMGLNQWYHVAATRASGTVKLFLNGTQIQSGTNSTNIDNTTSPFVVGASSSFSNYEYRLNGNISDARVVKGTAVYTGNFTPPTAPLTAVTNTKLLVQSTDAGIIDKSQTANFVALNGGTKSSTGYTKYLSSSMYFDGVDDTITVPQIDIKAGEDFTIECWHYLTSRTDSYPALFGNYSTWGTGGLGLFADHSSYSGGYQVAHNGTFPFLNIGTVTYNQWVHVALVRNGTTMTLYVDGTSAGSGTSGSVALPGVGTSFMIGRSSDNADGHIQGYLSDFRITQGLARYTSNFTAPTAALQG